MAVQEWEESECAAASSLPCSEVQSRFLWYRITQQKVGGQSRNVGEISQKCFAHYQINPSIIQHNKLKIRPNLNKQKRRTGTLIQGALAVLISAYCNIYTKQHQYPSLLCDRFTFALKKTKMALPSTYASEQSQSISCEQLVVQSTVRLIWVVILNL